MTKYPFYATIYSQEKGDIMVEKKITDKDIIRKLVNRNDNTMLIQYNTKNKRAWFKTDSMIKRKAIDLSRVINL